MRVRRKQAIRQLYIGFLLLLFVLGNTPRQWLHDLFATHSGCTVVGRTHDEKECMQPDRLHCRQLDVVIASPFLEPATLLLQAPLFHFGEPAFTRFSVIPSGYSCRSGLRGPPAPAC
jgi:hypothetical protein